MTLTDLRDMPSGSKVKATATELNRGKVFVKRQGAFIEVWTGPGPQPRTWVGRLLSPLAMAALRPERVKE